MKGYQALLPLVAAMMIAGCGSRSTAESVVGQAEGAIATLKGEAEVVAPAELKAAEGTLAQMKQNLDQKEYKVVVAEVPEFNAKMKTLKDAVASAQTADAAATQEWSTLNAEVPKSVEAIQARVDGIKPPALPKDVTKEEFETAKTELESLKTTWSEATAAASNGQTAVATEKGRMVQQKADALKSQLGMNETVAAVAAPAPGTN